MTSGSSQIKITFVSPDYSPEKVKSRYVRFSPRFNAFHFCEVGEDSRYDIRQGVVIDPSIIPEEIQTQAKEMQNKMFGYVVWPFK